MLETSPDFAYYMLPNRAYELLAGALLAMWAADKGTGYWSNRTVQATATMGLTGIAGCFIFQSEHDGFPGLSILPVTIATLLLLASGGIGRSPITPFLESLPMRWFGDASYSIYLWHWPVLAYTRYALIDIAVSAGFILFAATIGLAGIRYYLVEQPFRNSSLTLKGTASRYLLLPAILLGVFGLFLHQSEGVAPWTNVKDLERARVKSDALFSSEYVCQRQILTLDDMKTDRCAVGETEGAEPNILVWGDSKVAHSSCPPIFGETDSFTNSKSRAGCRLSKPIIEASLPNYDVVILSASWQAYQNVDSEFSARVIDTV